MFIDLSQIETVAPPLAPQSAKLLPPGCPPHSGGESSEFGFWKIRHVLPPAPPNTQNTTQIDRKSPPHRGGARPNITNAPPLSGGEHEKISEKPQKPEIEWLPPKPQKVPPKTPWLPPPVRGGFLGAVGSPQGFWVTVYTRYIKFIYLYKWIKYTFNYLMVD